MFAVAGQTNLNLQHEARLEGEFFDEGVRDEKIIDPGTQVVGCETNAGAFLSALEKSGGGHGSAVM